MNEATVTDLRPLRPLAERWMALFANRTRPYAVQQLDGSYRWIYEELTPQLVAAHLSGELTLACSSSDARGCARWGCLDVDVPGSLPQLLALRRALAALGLPGLVEASRRGGHLWLLLDEPVPVVALRHAVAEALSEAAARGVEISTHELYPDAIGRGMLGHAVRLPLGVHRRTGLRYPLFDAQKLPCAFTTMDKAAEFVLAAARVKADPLRERWQNVVAGRVAATVARAKRSGRTGHGERVQAAELAGAHLVPGPRDGTRVGERVGTRSGVIRWVDAQVSPLELLTELAPEVEMRRAGRGYIGWCPFHDDRAPDATTGAAGSASFYVIEDRRYGWSWRCLSTHCAHSVGPMRHSFRLLQDLLGISVAAAIREAMSRWPQSAATALENGEDLSLAGKEVADGDGA